LSQAFAKTFGSVIGILGALANFVLVPVLAFYQLVHFHELRRDSKGSFRAGITTACRWSVRWTWRR
jgi:predicted PurR-regulated permease PerM